MSIFREPFPDFVQNELDRRQDGIFTRDFKFLHQLNSRSAWVRMTSGVNTIDSKGQITSELAKKYVMQGGVLNHSIKETEKGPIDVFTQKSGLGDETKTYSNFSQDGQPNRTGIRPMPGITSVDIKTKGAYGSLQEATVNFICWDIKQLEELEVLYMRPGYTVLLEFGWNFAKVNNDLPKYDILNSPPIALNDAFAKIYTLIDQSGGTYDALLGYVKNYNWSARDDGGYDCSTSIISLGEVLESLKCNWVPSETKALASSGTGILNLLNTTGNNRVVESYQQGIIPGLLQELGNQMNSKPAGTSIPVPDGDNTYNLFRIDIPNDPSKRGGLTKYIAPNSNAEIYITLGSFCDLLNKYVLPKGAENTSLTEIVTYETGYSGTNYVKKDKSLKCIASPLALSTNLGVCYVKNTNWTKLNVKAAAPPAPSTPSNPLGNAPLGTLSRDISNYIVTKKIEYVEPKDTRIAGRFASNIRKYKLKELVIGAISTYEINTTFYTYNSSDGIKADIKKLATDLGEYIVNVRLVNNKLIWIYGDPNQQFTSKEPFSNPPTINFFDLFYPRRRDDKEAAEKLYDEFFDYNYDGDGKTDSSGNKYQIIKNILFSFDEDPWEDGNKDTTDVITNTNYKKENIVNLLIQELSNVKPRTELQPYIDALAPAIAAAAASQAAALDDTNAVSFLDSTSTSQQLGIISNIYVNINFLYEQAISKNLASSDTQNKNTISIRNYLQTIVREIQNSLGNINNFDIQVDNRNAIGRIIDINFTGDPTQDLFTIQIHNTKSIVRNYKFASKIFPEMGAIIAISAQDATGIGKLGYDNATLVAWNEGITDRLIPKKDFNSDIALNDLEKSSTALLPFLTGLLKYFSYITGAAPNTTDLNLVFGGLNFAYRDFLALLDKFDPENHFKTIIPTELSLTLDGIGGIIIGNLFKINQDIVPRGYRNIGDRKLAYIVTRLSHQLSQNDWTTEIGAYPIVFESSKRTRVWEAWNINVYPSSPSGTQPKRSGTKATAGSGRKGGVGPVLSPVTSTSATQAQRDAMDKALTAVFAKGGKNDWCARYTTSIGAQYIKALKKETVDGTIIPGGGDANEPGHRTKLETLGYTQQSEETLSKEQLMSKIDAGPWNIGDIIIYFAPGTTTLRHSQIYTGGSSVGGGYLWASSWSDNYTHNFIHKRKALAGTQYQVYVYTPPIIN